MKKLIILLSFLFLMGNNSFSQSGIQFTEGTWKELLAKAEKENKLIFMDAYAEWCGPCKKMSKEVFTQQAVGEYFNKQFINVKMDMEKGEGIGLAGNFGIMAYPTLLFIDKKGDVVHRAVGYHTTDLLLELGASALDPDKNISAIQAKYDQGDRSPGLLKNLAFAKYDAMDGTYGETAAEYLATQQDWGTDENMDFIMRMTDDLDSDMAQHLMKNKPAYEKKYGPFAVSGKVEELVQNKINHAETEADLRGVEKLYADLYPDKAENMAGRLKMGFYAQREDWGKFAGAANAYYAKFPAEDWSELNEAAWLFYQVVENKKDLKTAVQWSKKSIKMDKNFYNTDTLASLYYKLGKKGKALKTANQAIALAKESGDDYSETQALIQKIKAL
ncbi:MAG: thioredoxin domain-containing protein [Saprospiraceae bacterium]